MNQVQDTLLSAVPAQKPEKSAGNKTVAILQSNYIPWKGYFDMINSVDEFVFYDDVQYTRRDWRNRNKVKTKDGLLWLTIPVDVKGKYLQKIRETKIVGKDWARSHFDTFAHHYRHAPEFERYVDTLAELYKTAAEIEYLSEVNFLFIQKICQLLGIKTSLRWSHEFDLADGKSERLLSVCQQLGASKYVSGPAAKDYLDCELFTANNMEVEWYGYAGYPEYRQLHEPFDHSVTILDLLLNCGADSVKYMKIATGVRQ